MINRVILVGNVGCDSEINNGVAKFSLATSKSYIVDNEKKTETEWHNVVCFKKLAEIAEKYIKKGMQLYVEGELHYYKYDDKNYTQIIAKEIKFLNKKEN